MTKTKAVYVSENTHHKLSKLKLQSKGKYKNLGMIINDLLFQSAIKVAVNEPIDDDNQPDAPNSQSEPQDRAIKENDNELYQS